MRPGCGFLGIWTWSGWQHSSALNLEWFEQGSRFCPCWSVWSVTVYIYIWLYIYYIYRVNTCSFWRRPMPRQNHHISTWNSQTFYDREHHRPSKHIETQNIAEHCRTFSGKAPPSSVLGDDDDDAGLGFWAKDFTTVVRPSWMMNNMRFLKCFLILLPFVILCVAYSCCISQIFQESQRPGSSNPLHFSQKLCAAQRIDNSLESNSMSWYISGTSMAHESYINVHHEVLLLETARLPWTCIRSHVSEHERPSIHIR